MTVEEIKRDKVLKYKLQKDLLFFYRYFFKQQYGFKANISTHHTEMCKYLHAVARGEILRLIINIPPRYGKTDIAVKAFVAWTMANNSRAKFIHLSYSDELALDNSADIKETITGDEYSRIFGVELKADSRSKKKWYTTQGGGVYATSAGGQVTGFGAGTTNEEIPDDMFSDGQAFGGAIVIDDPLKPDDANSETLRKRINARYNSTISSRVNSRKTPVIVIMQRVHEDDMSGYLLDGGSGEEWTHLKIPALNDDDEAIWSFKHTTDELLTLKKANDYVFAGQYMQNPAPIGGGIFKDSYWRYYTILPKIKYRFITVDTAQKKNTWNDYTVMQCWGVSTDGDICLLDMVRGKFEAPELRRVAKAFYAKHDAMKEPLRKMYIEDKSSGSSLIQDLRAKKMKIGDIQRNVDKIARALDAAPYIEAGRVYINENVPHVSDMLAEARQFPNAKNDDTLDPLMDAIDVGVRFAESGTVLVAPVGDKKTSIAAF